MRLIVSSNLERSVILIRIVNALIATLLLTYALFVISPSLRIGLIRSWLVLFFPITASTLASVNPSSWAIVGVGTFWALFAEFISPVSRRSRIMAGFGAVTTACIATSARHDSFVFIALIIVVVLIRNFNLHWTNVKVIFKKLGWWRSFIFFSVLGGLVITVWNFVTQRFTYLPSGTNNWGLYLTNLVDLPTYIAGAVGGWGRAQWPLGMGWNDTPVPVFVPVVAISTCAYFVIDNQSHLLKMTKFALGLLLLGSVSFVLQTLQVRPSNGDFFLQPRYLLPLIIVAVGISCAPQTNIRRELFENKKSSFGIGMLLILSGTLSLHSNIGRYTLNQDGVNDFLPLDISSGRSWWWNTPISPMVVWIVGFIATAGFVFFALLQARDSLETTLQD